VFSNESSHARIPEYPDLKRSAAIPVQSFHSRANIHKYLIRELELDETGAWVFGV